MVEPSEGRALFSTADAEQYDRHVGRYNAELARALIALAEVGPGPPALVGGGGPGARTKKLAPRLGPDRTPDCT